VPDELEVTLTLWVCVVFEALTCDIEIVAGDAVSGLAAVRTSVTATEVVTAGLPPSAGRTVRVIVPVVTVPGVVPPSQVPAAEAVNVAAVPLALSPVAAFTVSHVDVGLETETVKGVPSLAAEVTETVAGVEEGM
jgi:hypothetical protein